MENKTSARLVYTEVSNIISIFINNSQLADGLRLSKPSLVYFFFILLPCNVITIFIKTN